jgi:hypothetical protein
MVLAGISGGIGNGKSTFANFLAAASPAHYHWESSDLINEVANDLRSQALKQPSADDIPEIITWLKLLPNILEVRVHVSTNLASLKLSPKALRDNPEIHAKLFEYLRLIEQNPELAKVTIDQTNKALFRPLQQWLGGYLVSQLDGIWYTELLKRVRETPNMDLVTIGGVRFPNDADIIHKNSGYILSIIRPGSGDQDISDPTERYRQAIVADTTIYNNGSLQQLELCAKRIYNDLSIDKLLAEYRATSF